MNIRANIDSVGKFAEHYQELFVIVNMMGKPETQNGFYGQSRDGVNLAFICQQYPWQGLVLLRNFRNPMYC